MTTIADICQTYGISRSTARRRVKECFGDAPMTHQGIELDAPQTHQFAEFMNKRSAKSALSDAQEAHQSSVIDAPEVRALVAQYEARISDLQAEVERLHAALEREQSAHVGFWSRLGQRLLGDGSKH